MKAISLWQPWATFVAIGWKTIETRTHQKFNSLIGQSIAIHATMKIDKLGEWFDYIPSHISIVQGVNIEQLISISCGTIVCTASVTAMRWAPNVDFKEHERWNWQAMCEIGGKFCLFLEDIKPLRIRIPFRGGQGIFNVPDELIKEGL